MYPTDDWYCMSHLKYGIPKRVSLGKKEKFHGKLDSQRLASAAGAPRTSTSMRPNKTHFVFLHGQRPHACDAQVRLLCMPCVTQGDEAIEDDLVLGALVGSPSRFGYTLLWQRRPGLVSPRPRRIMSPE